MLRRLTTFNALWLFIILVSVIDGYLVYEHRSFIMHNELNPVGRGLLHLNSGQVWYLLATKFVGTGLACGVLLLIHLRNRVVGTAVAAGMALFQFCLLLFLLLA